MQIQVENMIEKLKHVPPDRLAEISDFIDFILQKDQENRLKRDFVQASEASFANIWDNDEDSAYDSI